MTGNEVSLFSDFESKLSEYKSRYVGAVYDMDDKKQEKQARSDRFTISQVIGRLDAAHKDLKAPLLEKTRLLDSRRKLIKDQLLSIQSGIKDQIAAVEAKRQKRVDDITDRIGLIAAMIEVSPMSTAADVYAAMKEAEAISIDDSFEEFKSEALNTKVNTCIHLSNLYAEMSAKEKEAEERRVAEEEMRRKAQAEREEDIRLQAKIDAELAAKKAVEDEKRRADEAIEAEKRRADEAVKAEKRRADEAVKAAERAARQEKEAAENEAAAKKARADEVEREKKKREADSAHRASVIEKSALLMLESAPIDMNHAMKIATDISEGKFPHIKMSF